MLRAIARLRQGARRLGFVQRETLHESCNGAPDHALRFRFFGEIDDDRIGLQPEPSAERRREKADGVVTPAMRRGGTPSSNEIAYRDAATSFPHRATATDAQS
jgi:hypothetical protein